MLRLAAVVVGCAIAVLTASAADTPATKPEFEDRFDGKLADGWKWLREDPKAWRVKDGGLEVRIQPGDANTVKNALVRPAPDRRKAGRFAVEVTVTSLAEPTNQWEQAGITWYVDGKPVFKLMKELVDGKKIVVPGHVPMNARTVQFRLVVSGEDYVAQFRPDAKGEYKAAGKGKLPPPGKDEQVSLQCYHGPPDREHWVRFDDFRIMAVGEGRETR